MAVVIATLVKVHWRCFGQVFCPLDVQEVPTPSIPLCDMMHSYSSPEVIRHHMDNTFKMAEQKRPNSGCLMTLLNYITHHETIYH